MDLPGLVALAVGLKEALWHPKDVIEAAGDVRDKRDAKALESVDATVRQMIGSLGDSATEEALDAYLTQHAQGYKAKADIFTPEYRERVKAEFLSGRAGAFTYDGVSGEAIDRYFDKLEGLLHAVLEAGDVLILRQTVSNGAKLDQIHRETQSNSAKLDQLLSRSAPHGFRNSNELYRTNFTEPLFLHKNVKDTKVNLLNLFVPHRFSIMPDDRNPAEPLTNYLARFIQQEDTDRPPFLFIEGDAGCGKSSLAAYLNYYYWNDPDFRQKVFGDFQLVTVRLRDIDIPEKGEDERRLVSGILNFLHISRNELEKLHPVLFLDGYDELCTIEELRNPQMALYGLRALKCKIIITTRPQYIRIQGFNHPHNHIVLQHFDENQRQAWLDHYEKDCGETIEDQNRQYLKRIDEEDDPAGICDTPMGLYMVAKGRFQAGELENEWALYHRIFSRELGETAYSQSKSEEDDFPEHAIFDKHYMDNLYRVSEEMAYYLYRKNNADLLIPDQDVKAIVKGLAIEDTRTEKIIKDCYALCGYWKVSADRLCVEFYHNNIRDFFLCEKIMRELNSAYQEYESALRNPDADITPFLKRLCTLFQHGYLEDRVLDFLRLRADYNWKNHPDFCVQREKEERFLPRIFETLLTSGSPYMIIPEENPVQTVSRILANIVQVYEQLYSVILSENEYIKLWKDVKKVNADKTLRLLSSEIFRYAPRIDLRNAYLRNAYLKRANLTGADLERANLTGADLERANLTGANLTGADLERADLIEVSLTGANLTGANLTDAYLTRANLTDANLTGAKMFRTNLYSSNLTDANLSGADLCGAYLPLADLTLAYLTNVDLTDADLTLADLRGADLIDANLRAATVTGAHMENCNLDGAKLDGCNLQDAIGVPEKYLPQNEEAQEAII